MLILFLVYVQAQFTSKLHFHYPNTDESIAVFTITNKNQINFTNITKPIYLFLKSLLENLHIDVKVKELYISFFKEMITKCPLI
ncbi:unnamed protein product [Paramecium primaurelia]|uniref:Uncharacterized protein n=1 Tax=Paramecium primaurelia TaxID=5886 RepID=A0A8S1K3U3_PARPR|nr:unnamed protein product [Paramecium primaurelia]